MNEKKAEDLVDKIFEEELSDATPKEEVKLGKLWITWFIVCLYERDFEVVLKK